MTYDDSIFSSINLQVRKQITAYFFCFLHWLLREFAAIIYKFPTSHTVGPRCYTYACLYPVDLLMSKLLYTTLNFENSCNIFF